jgi:PAS domain S-box-containing protein
MDTTVLLAASAAIQFAAAVLALRLMRITGRTAWALIATAVLLMGIRRGVTLGRVLGGESAVPADPVAEWIALVISGLMLAGIAWIGPFFGRVERSEAAVRRSEARLRQIIDLVPHMIFAKDREGRFLLANRAVAEMYGTSVAGLIGRRHADFHADPTELAHMLADDRQVIDGGEPKFIPEETFVDARGERHVLQTVKIPYVTSDLDEPAVLGVAVDVSERKAVEASLEQRSQELERSNAELEQFAYAASHDLQAPLRAVVSFLQLLEEEAGERLGARGRKYLATAVDGGRRMQALIEALLRYARVGHGEAERRPVALDELLEQLVADLGPGVDAAGARVTWDALPTVECDPDRLRHVLQNLLENALRFRGDAAPRIHVSARREADAWWLSVADNGIGIDPAHRAQIFEVFRRLHPRDRYPGTGIGLAVVKKLVESGGGRIEVESEEGKGAVFSFSLPDPPAGAAPAPARKDQ